MRILVLDDDEVRHEQFRENLKEHSVLHVYTAEEAGQALAAEKFDLAYLDHDLQDFQNNPSGYGVIEQTGFDVARYIARYLAPQKRPDKIIVHSWNPAGAMRMVKELRQNGVVAVYEPFGGQSGKAQKFAKPYEVQLTEGDDPHWVTVTELPDESDLSAAARDQRLSSTLERAFDDMRGRLGPSEPSSLAELKEHLEDQDHEEYLEKLDKMVERMQTPESRAAARSLFTATPEEFGQAAVDAAKKNET